MNCDRDLILSFIEEDNIQRAYFRVRPLLTIHGDVQEEAAANWPDNACLRIVPDRNEQHTFKDRMRSLGSYCIVNLLGIPQDANKIRTNKNYRPERGETNQFILYSDAVQALPDHTFFQVLKGQVADYAALRQSAITPVCYIQDDETLYGPVTAETSDIPDAAEIDGKTYDVSCPDCISRTFLCLPTPESAWPKTPVAEVKPAEAPAIKAPEKPGKVEETPVKAAHAVEAPKPAVEEQPKAEEPKKEEEALPIGTTLNILDKKLDFEQTLQQIGQSPLSSTANLLHDAPSSLEDEVVETPPILSGTPLVPAQMPTATPQPKNKTQEFVSAQWRVVKNDPPAAPLAPNAKLSTVENPIENAMTALKQAWLMRDSRSQLVQFLLSLDGMRSFVDPASPSAEVTPLQRQLRQRLVDLEAERLQALVQLDQAKADYESFRKEAAQQVARQLREEIATLTATKETLDKQIADLKSQVLVFSQQRDEMLRLVDALSHDAVPAAIAKAMADAALVTPVHGVPLRLTPVPGEKLTLDELITRLNKAMEASRQPAYSRNAAIALLLLLAICPKFAFKGASTPAASTLMGNMIRHMGWQSSFALQTDTMQQPLLALQPPDTTPSLLLTTMGGVPAREGLKVVLLQPMLDHRKVDAWPVYPLNLQPSNAFVPMSNQCGTPVSDASLKALIQPDAVKAEEIDQALSNILSKLSPLSGKSYKEMCTFISSAATVMDGGLPSAIDWAVAMWMLPGVHVASPALKEALAELPMCCKPV